MEIRRVNGNLIDCAITLVAIVCLSIGCGESPAPSTIEDHALVSTWVDETLFLTQYTPSNSPTYASRVMGYIGLTMYESVVHGFPEYQSLAGQLTDLDSLPLPKPGAVYNWPIALNAGQAQILRSLYNQTSDANKVTIDSLEEALFATLTYGVADEVVERSVEYGQEVASSIFDWSQDDGGHRAYLRNFDKDMVHPEWPGSWKPPLYAQSFSHYPLHPYWGDNRRFVPANAWMPIPEIISYSRDTTSPYYQQFLEVYEQDLELTQDQKEIAIWWGDDPDESFTPPGHSYFIANLAVKANRPSLIKSAETFARVGMAVADAFINCWKWKYHHFSERPNTYIPEMIDPEWVSFWPDPPFPAFPSGHAIQAASSATVLEDLYGPEFHFIDSSHVNRKRDEVRDVDFRPRTFETFWGVAQETADSRFFGGIHTPQDNEVGLQNGRKIGEHVNQLKWNVNSDEI